MHYAVDDAGGSACHIYHRQASPRAIIFSSAVRIVRSSWLWICFLAQGVFWDEGQRRQVVISLPVGIHLSI